MKQPEWFRELLQVWVNHLNHNRTCKAQEHHEPIYHIHFGIL